MAAQEEIIRLRRAGLSYKAIGAAVGRSEQQVKRLCDAAYTEYAQTAMQNIGAVLGEEMDRMDGLIRAASAVLNSSKSSPAEKMRALDSIRRCSEAKIRWTGAGAAEKLIINGMDRDSLAASEVAGLDDAQLENELKALGYTRDEGEQDTVAAIIAEANTTT